MIGANEISTTKLHDQPIIFYGATTTNCNPQQTMHPISFTNITTLLGSFFGLLFIYNHLDPIHIYYFGDSYKKLSKHRQHRFRLTVLSLINAIICTFVGLYQLLFCEESVYDISVNVMFFVLGYFLHDMYQEHKYPIDVLHHILGIIMIFVPLYNESLLVFIPHYSVTEVSTIALDIMWMARELNDGEKGIVYDISSKAFVILFFIARICWMTGVTVSIRISKKWENAVKAVGRLRYGIYALCALQFYWFAKILQKILFPDSPSKKREKKEKEND